MRIEVRVPQLPESVTEATLVSWHKKAGDPVRRDENLIDLETDKVVLELPAPADGVIVELVQQNGATVVSNDVIAIIDSDASGAATAPRGPRRPRPGRRRRRPPPRTGAAVPPPARPKRRRCSPRHAGCSPRPASIPLRCRAAAAAAA